MSKRVAVQIGAVMVLGAALLTPGIAAALPTGAAQPPNPTVAFSPGGIQPNATSTVTITLANPNGTSLSGVAFSDTLPANVVVATSPAVNDTCGGTVTADASSGSVALSGGAIAANSSCAVSVDVTSPNTGVYDDSTGPVTANESGQSASSASGTLDVANPPTISTGFSPTSVPQGTDSELYFTIQNPNSNSTPPDSDVTLTGVSFTDTLPAGLVVASPNQATSDCGGTLTATPGASTVTFTGGTIVPQDPNGESGGTCDLSLDVQATGPGPLNNQTGAVSANESGAGSASNAATLAVTAPALPPTVTLAFADPSIPLHGSTVLTETVSNPNSGASLDDLTLDNPLPSGLAVASTPAVGETCASAQGATVTAAPGGNDVSATSFSLPASASCTVTVALTGTAAGSQVDTTGAPTATYDDGNVLAPVTGSPATASTAVIAPPHTTAAFGAGHITVGGGTSFTITIANPNSAAALSGVGLTVALSSGLSFSGPAGSCGSTAVTASSGSLSLSGASLAAGASCTISESVSASTVGGKSAITSAVSSTEGGTGAPAAAGLTVDPVPVVVAPPVASAYFAPASVTIPRMARLWLTVRNPNRSVGLTGVSLVDQLPSGLRVATPGRILGYCGHGAITAPSGGASIVLSGGSMPGGGHCTFSALLRVSAAGRLTDRTGTPSAAGVGGGAGATAVLRVAPSNRLILRDVTAATGGRFAVAVEVPGPGRIAALLSAPTASLAALRPARGQFTYGTAAATPHHSETLAFAIFPNAAGRRLLAHHHGTIRLSLHIAFTPTGGTTRTIGRGGLQPI